jgi:hypothetical protein
MFSGMAATISVDVKPGAMAVGDAVDVDVDADPRLAAADAQRQMGTFDAHAGKCQHHFLVAGQFAAVLLDDLPGDGLNPACLALVERAGRDQPVDLVHRELGYVGRGACSFEQAPGDG